MTPSQETCLFSSALKPRRRPGMGLAFIPVEAGVIFFTGYEPCNNRLDWLTEQRKRQVPASVVFLLIKPRC